MAQVVVVTGCSSGLGEALAIEAFKRKFRVIATARNLASIDHLKEQGMHTMQLDVTWPKEKIDEFAQQAKAVYGSIYYVINNAGIALCGLSEEFSAEEMQKIISTNLTGPINVCCAFLPILRQAREGFILNITSEAGTYSEIGLSFYAMTKAGLDQFSDCLRPELVPFNIHVMTCQLGAFLTAIKDNVMFTKRGGTIKDYELLSGQDKLMPSLERMGKPAAGAIRLWDIVTSKGAAEGRTPPKRFALGEDAALHINNVLKGRLQEVQDWKSLSAGQDIAKASPGEVYL